MKVICIPSLSFAQTWFIFRESNVEVRVVVKNNMLRPSHQLFIQEVQWFRDNVLQKGYVVINSKMNGHNFGN